MRRIPAVLLALLAAAPLLAQKPGAETDPVRERYRVQGVALCVADLNAAEGVGPDDSEAVCGCAFTEFMPRWPTGALPPLDGGRLRTVAGSELIACAAARDGALAGAVARQLAASPSAIVAAPAPDEGGKPGLDADPAERPGFDFRTWVDSLSLPAWVTRSGLPLWVWIPLVVFVFLFLRGLMRRRDGKDLMGPPRTLDPSTRRPDLPPPRL